MLMLRFVLAVSLGAAALAIGGAGEEEAGASGPLYLWSYYSDASKTQFVGWSQDECIGDTVSSGPVQGQRTPWYDIELIGQCPGDLF